MKEKRPKYYFIFRAIRSCVDFFYPKTEIVGKENLSEPCIIVGNHAQMNGPIVGELYLPDSCYTWCASQMMTLKDVPGYAFEDFWSQKPGYIRWFFKILSYLIAPLSVIVFNSARTIPVYRDMRIINTFRKSSEMLNNGRSIVIFPECCKPHNNIIYEFQDNFITIAKLHYKRTGKALSFVPMYVAPDLKKVFLGEPTRFDASVPIDEEQKRICNYLMGEITRIARSLPEHKVVPYPNIPKKNYPLNICKEENESEKAYG